MKCKLLALFVVFLLPLALATPVTTLKEVEHQSGLDFKLGGESFSFKPSEVTDYVSWVDKLPGGYKWGLNFTLPSVDFKVSFNFEDKQRIVVGEKDYQFIINDDFFVDFQDVVDSGLTVDLKNKKIEIKGFDDSLVGEMVSIDPFVASATGVNYLKRSNQRKFLYNSIDDSWWISFVGNDSCTLGSSYDNGTTWSFTNVSEGAVLDYHCSHDVDDYGNVWAYWQNSTPTVLGRVLGWNGVGYDMGSVFNVTSSGAIAGANVVLRTCGDSIGVLYRGGVGGVETCFTACRGISAGVCNQSGLAFWNSTNQTTNSFCSLNTGVWSSDNFALDCVDGDFVGLSQLTEGANLQTRLLYGNDQGNGDWLWNTFNLFNDGTSLGSSIFHNSTTVFVASPVTPVATAEVHYRECSAGPGCNASGNWSAAIQLSVDGVASGVYGVSIGLFNNTEPLCVWDSTGSSIYGAWFNSSAGAWNDAMPIIASSGVNKYPNLMRNNSYYPAQLIWGNDTSSEVWHSPFNFTAAEWIRVRTYDEQTGNQIYFDADVYNSVDLDEYDDVLQIWKHNSLFPQGSVRLDFSNTSYYGRSRLLWINENTTEDMKVYLINASAADVIAVRFHIRTVLEVPISNATILIQRNIGGGIQTVGELKSDFNGDGLFYLEVGAPYQVTVTHSAYASFFGDINPSDSDYTIHLTGSSAAGVGGNYTAFTPTVLDDVYWYLSPFNRRVWSEATNITFFVESTSSNLTYWGMNISNSSNSSLFFKNDTASVTGGIMYYVLNISHFNTSAENVTVFVWFSHSPDFNLTALFPLDFDWSNWLYPHSLISARETLYESGLSNVGIALFVLFITMFITAWVARMNPVAGLIIAGIVLSFFAFSGVFDYSNNGVLVVGGAGVFVISIATAISLIYIRSPT